MLVCMKSVEKRGDIALLTVTQEDSKIKETANVILPFDVCDEHYVEDIGDVEIRRGYSFFKRAFDILVSLSLLLITAVPMLVIAILISCTSCGNAFYCQERLGLNGKRIKIIKFRTMFADAEKAGAQWSTGDGDVRITKVGRFLRKFHIDELPQLVSIIKGDMSIVGPRPEREIFYEEFEKYIHGFRQRLKVKPGLTGLAQVNGGYYLKPEEKIIYDIQYIKTRSFWTDIKIMFATVKVVFSGKDSK